MNTEIRTEPTKKTRAKWQVITTGDDLVVKLGAMPMLGNDPGTLPMVLLDGEFKRPLEIKITKSCVLVRGA